MSDAPHTHRYAAQIAWSGSTAEGFDAYTRTHEATCPPATRDQPLALTADPAFNGDASQLNPEQPLVLAATDTAHRHCFIANSLSAEIRIEPTFHRVGA